ncbi:hypothetical protein PHISCL_09670 [Aspergillus sclerotialis]|uniref:Phosphotransferase enzyme family n=1 Tax=Aspergillus sclerotialis TaxID=2070753 RepID=A0A3A2Z5N0_9EURO|nr:hypothetical protein PHISCL_09670 [Aspergillus sclerotialis]
MWKPVSLPYKSDSLPLPAIPTAAEIRACTNVLWDGAHRIVALNNDVIVKYGGGLGATEGQNLIYLERYVPKVPAPRLYAMFEEDGKTYLIMQRIPGVPLDSIWKSLTDSEKNGITAKLIPVFDAMRKAECPWPDFYGGLDGGKVHHWLFYSQKKKDFKFWARTMARMPLLVACCRTSESPLSGVGGRTLRPAFMRSTFLKCFGDTGLH